MAKQLWPISGSQNPKLKAERMMWHGDRHLLSWEAKEFSWTFPSSSSTLNPAGHQVIFVSTTPALSSAPHCSCSHSGFILSHKYSRDYNFRNGLLIFSFCHHSVHLPTDLTTEPPYLMTSGALQLLTGQNPMTLSESRHDLALPHRGSQSFLSCWAEITLVQKGHWSRSEKGVPFLVG